jgi:hypothetical protein
MHTQARAVKGRRPFAAGVLSVPTGPDRAPAVVGTQWRRGDDVYATKDSAPWPAGVTRTTVAPGPQLPHHVMGE